MGAHHETSAHAAGCYRASTLKFVTELDPILPLMPDGLLAAAVGLFSVVLVAIAPAVTTVVRSCKLLPVLVVRPAAPAPLLLKAVCSCFSTSLLVVRGSVSLLVLRGSLSFICTRGSLLAMGRSGLVSDMVVLPLSLLLGAALLLRYPYSTMPPTANAIPQSLRVDMCSCSTPQLISSTSTVLVCPRTCKQQQQHCQSCMPSTASTSHACCHQLSLRMQRLQRPRPCCTTGA